jgi:DNA polymerase-3 subunit chi
LAEPVALPSVSFYVLDAASAQERLRVACRITDKAYRAGQHVLIWHTDEQELRTLDELLWTFGDDRGFVPHELVTPTAGCEAPVLLSNGAVPDGAIDVLINLAAEIPACAARSQRIVEIIDGEPARREAGRARFKAYRERGIQPASHNLRGE